MNGACLSTELEFLKSLWGLSTEEEQGFRTGPPGYIGWRNSFLGINSGAPYTFKSTGSVFDFNKKNKQFVLLYFVLILEKANKSTTHKVHAVNNGMYGINVFVGRV
jgi:hypothetical protein